MKRIAILCLLAVIAVPSMVYVVSQTWEARFEVKANVVAAGLLGVYWDPNCTQPVEAISFGDIEQGSSAFEMLYIRNGHGVAVALTWRSDAGEYIAGDDWTYWTGETWASIEGYEIGPGEVLETRYEIFIAPTATVGPVGPWTVELGTQ